MHVSRMDAIFVGGLHDFVHRAVWQLLRKSLRSKGKKRR